VINARPPIRCHITSTSLPRQLDREGRRIAAATDVED